MTYGAFDVVVSLVGAMFAPRPERVALELVRVCRSGGRIVMANWTPDGFVGQMFKIMGTHVPPSSLVPSPLLWGVESTVRERLSHEIIDLHLTRCPYPFHYSFGPSEVVEFYRMFYGPTHRAFSALEGEAQEALRHDFEQSSFGLCTTRLMMAVRSTTLNTSKWSRFAPKELFGQE